MQSALRNDLPGWEQTYPSRRFVFENFLTDACSKIKHTNTIGSCVCVCVCVCAPRGGGSRHKSFDYVRVAQKRSCPAQLRHWNRCGKAELKWDRAAAELEAEAEVSRGGHNFRPWTALRSTEVPCVCGLGTLSP